MKNSYQSAFRAANIKLFMIPQEKVFDEKTGFSVKMALGWLYNLINWAQKKKAALAQV